MIAPGSRISTSVVLLVGLLIGWAMASLRPAPLLAGAGDRLGESAVATGPVMVRYDEGTKSPLALDAVYFLDYKGGRLLATVPALRQTTAATHVIERFMERDLVADFKIDLDTGGRPHFLMTTGAIGPYSAGWSPLYVFETTTSQVGVYRVQVQQTVGTARTAHPEFDLVELRSFAKTGAPGPASSRVPTPHS
jgi:hypothetical protein